MSEIEGLFKLRYGELHGSDWIRRIPVEDRKVFSEIGMSAHNYGKMGGVARSRTANRLPNGRFAPGNKSNSAIIETEDD